MHGMKWGEGVKNNQMLFFILFLFFWRNCSFKSPCWFLQFTRVLLWRTIHGLNIVNCRLLTVAALKITIFLLQLWKMFIHNSTVKLCITLSEKRSPCCYPAISAYLMLQGKMVDYKTWLQRWVCNEKRTRATKCCKCDANTYMKRKLKHDGTQTNTVVQKNISTSTVTSPVFWGAGSCYAARKLWL